MSLRTSRPARVRAICAVAGLAAAAVTTALAPPAQSAPPSQPPAACPDAYPVSDLTQNQPVSGLTVSVGNTPDGFTGHVLGVLDDGIAPGIDMIIIDFSNAKNPGPIDQNGIWAGMSGSPVYASDGRLIGAVSYGLTYSPSPVAGVTPAADMQALLGGGSSAAAPADTQRVALPQRMQQRLVSDGLASPSDAQQGLTRLPIPLGISGAVSTTRLSKAASHINGPSLLGQPDVLPYKTASAPSDAPGTDEIFPGSNLAASISYGDLTAAGVGTTTMVCDGQAVGFGHPFNFTGESTMTMHGADAITVLDDPIGGSFKLANLTGPVGEITGDHLAGISGPLGQLPDTTLVDSNVTDVSTGKSRTGDTHVSLPDYLPDVAAFAELGNQDVVFDHVGKGSALVHFTVEGMADGEPFTLVRTNRFASAYDISYEAIFEMADDVYTLLHNKFADVTIDAVRITTQLDPTYRAYSVGKVQRKVGTHYVTLTRSSLVKARPGSTLTLRVTLNSKVLGTKLETVKVKVPSAPIGSFGELSVGRVRISGSTPKSFDDLVTKLDNAPRNDQLTAAVRLFTRKIGGRTSSASTSVHDVISGSKGFELRLAD
jgi:hypothetical protein